MTPAQSLIADWQHRLTVEQRRSPHSVRAYIATAHRFVAFLADHRGQHVDGAMLAALEPADLRSYLAARRGEGLSNTSAARELSAVRSFLRHIGGMAAAVPQVRGPRVRKGLPRPVTPDEAVGMADALYGAASPDWQGARDHALLLLLYGAGLRIAEALSLTGSALGADDVLRVTGKRGKMRQVALIAPVRDAIHQYAALCPYALGADAPLFRGARGGAYSDAIFRRHLARVRQALGIADSATPHAMRHSFASHLLAEGVDLRALQMLLGHASLSSTQVYTKVDSTTLLAQYTRAHPRG